MKDDPTREHTDNVSGEPAVRLCRFLVEQHMALIRWQGFPVPYGFLHGAWPGRPNLTDYYCAGTTDNPMVLWRDDEMRWHEEKTDSQKEWARGFAAGAHAALMSVYEAAAKPLDRPPIPEP